jgi:hypothetical protein
MRDKILYEYAVIRLVPKVEREEFINIGVILYARKPRFLSMKSFLDSSKIAALSDEVDVEMIQDYLTGWEEICAGVPKGGKIGELEIHVRFRWLTASRSTIIQSSAVHPGYCEDPQQTLEDLYERFVG